MVQLLSLFKVIKLKVAKLATFLFLFYWYVKANHNINVHLLIYVEIMEGFNVYLDLIFML